MYPYSNMHYFYYYYVSKCIVSKWLLYVSNIKRCFQYTGYVSKRLFMFPISNFCFQYPIHISKCKRCFQSTMFSMYDFNIKGFRPYFKGVLGVPCPSCGRFLKSLTTQKVFATPNVAPESLPWNRTGIPLHGGLTLVGVELVKYQLVTRTVSFEPVSNCFYN